MNEKCNVLVVMAILTGFLAGCGTATHSKSVSASTCGTAQVRELAIGMADVDAQGILFLDLDRNRSLKAPVRVRFSQLGGLEITPALSQWLRGNGIDLLVQLVPEVKVAGSATTFPGAHLRGVNLRGVTVLEDEIRRTSKADSLQKSWPNPDPEGDVSSSRLVGLGVEVYRVLLRTQEGRVFALEEEERLPDGVRIRYEEVATLR